LKNCTPCAANATLRDLSRRRSERLAKWASDGRGAEYIRLVAAIGRQYPDSPVSPTETRDPNDDYLVALARLAKADAIVSVDLDLLEADLDGVAAYRPRAFLELLAEHES